MFHTAQLPLYLLQYISLYDKGHHRLYVLINTGPKVNFTDENDKKKILQTKVSVYIWNETSYCYQYDYTNLYVTMVGR